MVSLSENPQNYHEMGVRSGHLPCPLRYDITGNKNSRNAEEGETKTSSPSWGQLFTGNDDRLVFKIVPWQERERRDAWKDRGKSGGQGISRAVEPWRKVILK